MGTVIPFKPMRRDGQREPPSLRPILSSAVEAIGYDPAERLLDVRYPSGDVYRYFDVSPEHYRALLAADSIGRHLNEHIKPHHTFEKLG